MTDTIHQAIHPAIQPGHMALVTGGASGIGLAAASALLVRGMTVCLVDLPGEGLQRAGSALLDAGADAEKLVLYACDVGDADQILALRETVLADHGAVQVLLNNAGIQPGSDIFDESGSWQRVIDVNMWGVIRTAQAFAPSMVASQGPGLIINTGSKQGITTPPGDPAYNTSKAAVKAFTEALQHALRTGDNPQVEAKLFIPGFVFTGLTARGRTEKPDGAWTPEQTVAFLFQRVAAGDFYILCPDNEVDRPTDNKRIQWAAGDITQNRPPLSRWHPDYQEAFKTWLKS
jgi:NAD(P)-dependent dehydrogenase (short-subunit alcohol dehydrogenase family)